MSNGTDLVLKQKAEKVEMILKQKRVLVRSAVAFLIDISGSMEDLYKKGVVQGILQELLPVALNLDDNGELDMFSFQSGDNYRELPSVHIGNYVNYVVGEILNNSSVPKWGGTDFAPVLKAVLVKYGFYEAGKKGLLFGLGSRAEKYQAESNIGFPVTVYLVTDGENYDESATEDLFSKCQQARSNIYFNCIGIGNESFRFLQRMADKYDNVGFWRVGDLAKKMENDEIYDVLLPDELCRWLRGNSK